LRKINERQLIVELFIPTESGAQLDILLRIICNLFLASALPLFVLDIFFLFVLILSNMALVGLTGIAAIQSIQSSSG
jgi:hypothetical protein